jgi:hypothetical protein
MKLNSSITSNSVKLIDLYNKMNSGALVTRPDFQRNLVWKKQHKYAFIKTILLNFPFPEVYIASIEVDVDNLQAREIVVDGQQRLTTIVDYIKEQGDFKNQKHVTPFDNLTIDEKREFLNYSITVKDLKDIGIPNIKEIFKRINSTNYSLNSNEIINAEYGDGEFSMFCKQLVDEEFQPSIEITDIIIDEDIRKSMLLFFTNRNVFTNNDIKRMYDINFLMLISSTFLEGNYFGRNTKIDHYLKKYNTSFDVHTDVLSFLLNSIEIIKRLQLPIDGYWYNKANLFTLIIEFHKLNIDNIDIDKLESKLLELAKKVDVYFTDEDLSLISPDEGKYFEYARQGSHELAAREHRGKVISSLIEESTIQVEVEVVEANILNTNLELLAEKQIRFSTLIPTATGLRKSIMDAVSGVREFLKVTEIHNYETQELGQDHKEKIQCQFLIDSDGNTSESEVSLYRSNGRGDYRIWFSQLNEFAEPMDQLALLNNNGVINVYNLTKVDYTAVFNIM